MWISFTTDYGRLDGFVAACHGAIARIAPAARVIDITHEVPPGDVARGAVVLAQTVGDLPTAVHLAVVDPGVGTARRPIALRAPGGLLVGPDNGLLIGAAEALGGIAEAVELRNPAWRAPTVTRTFHGRDIFAPAAAQLVDGAPLADAGPAIDPAELVRLPEPSVEAGEGWLAAQVLSVDRFGNVQLAATALPAPRGSAVTIADEPGRVGETFADAPPGGLVLLIDSAGRVAVAANGAPADVALGVRPGDMVRITVGPVGQD
ncbi:SAM-dependent chlorinase/fluorinase [Asanoa sp. WMMD1127]|uniref:SAM hydrolase/SAM-dependent halogenase family protein n=1 Tax=Asanoa sp. WMMD1127 TaxID=3016107 RepID=UPI0024171AA3|nr:SAM-dependent chlorinase/fluorinase [Asanoa sp. WMMD1127]MDG4823694.1 SAM-dependent chlorinase/fluorinase [Asanoa sp. WMMD1127]